MRIVHKNYWLLLLVFTTLTACKTKKQLVKVPDEGTKVPVNKLKEENLRMLRSKDIPFNTLSMRGKATLDMNGNSNQVTMTVRIQKNEKIWVSLTAIAGIEVARALITPDSILVRNNIQAVGIRKPFSYLYRFSTAQLNFNMLQSVLTGNTIAELMLPEVDLQSDAGVFKLDGRQAGLGYSILFNTLFKPGELLLNDVKAGQAMKVVYSEYQQVTDAVLPTVLRINSQSGNKKTNISLDFTKIDRNVQLDFPFSLPKRFEIIN